MRETTGILASIATFLGLSAFCIWSQLQQHTPVPAALPSPEKSTPAAPALVPPPFAAAPSVIPVEPPRSRPADEPVAPAPSSAAVNQQAAPLQSSPEPLLTQIVEFPFESDTLSAQGQKQLEEVVRQLQQTPATRVVITGHSDNSGLENYNVALSQRRANAVKNYLLKQGFTDSRLTAEGVGSLHPRADNTTLEGRRQNRRTEIVVYPLDSTN